MQSAIKAHLSSCLFFSMLIVSTYSSAAEEITQIFTTTGQGSPLEISVDNETYEWGAGTELVLRSFSVDERLFEVAATADRVELVREDIAGVATGEPCGIYVERVDQSLTQLRTGYPGDGSGSGNCSMESVLESRVINRGTLDLFANTAPAAKNIERVDILFEQGLLAPLSDDNLSLAGYIIGEKRGNNPVQVAAITALDEQGGPAGYGALIRINAAGCEATEVCYTVTDILHQYSFFQSSSLSPQGFPSHLENSSENVAVAFISARTLGLSAGQLFYGMSVFPEDVVPSQHSLLDPASFPNDTQDEQIEPGDGADLMGGLSSWFVAQPVPQVRGQAFVDNNANGLPDPGEGGIADITLSLFADTDSNGILNTNVDATAATPVATNQQGFSLFTGLAPGSYFLELDASDIDIPAGMILASVNPAPFSVTGSESQLLYFAFVPDARPPTDPVANPDVFTINLPEGSEITTPATQLDVLANDEDPLGQGLTISDISASNNATIVVSGNQVSYTPKPGFLGNDTFSYTLIDGNGVTSSAVVSVRVTGSTLSSPPMANDDSFAITVTLGEAIVASNLAVLDNDTDPFAAGLTIVSTSESPHASIVVNSDNSLSYTPISEPTGSDVFTYTLQDGRGMESTATVTVNVSVVDPDGTVRPLDPVIETEVHGTGLASTVPASILILLLSLIARLTLCRKTRLSRSDR